MPESDGTKLCGGRGGKIDDSNISDILNQHYSTATVELYYPNNSTKQINTLMFLCI